MAMLTQGPSVVIGIFPSFFLQGVAQASWGNCPSSHPYAFQKGNLCCHYPMESLNTKGYMCFSSFVDQRSECCFDNKDMKCPSGKCLDYECENDSALFLLLS